MSSRTEPLPFAWPKLTLALLALVAACQEGPPRTSEAAQYAVPIAQDGEGVCSDIGDKRVCWRDAAVEIVARAVPRVPAPPLGFRCGGAGNKRMCEDRARNGGAFECGTTRCLQERPRMPDDGEWECVELSGAVYCHSRGPVAGMAPGPMDLGWLCGARRGATDGERICVDLDPDRPALATHRACRFELHFGVQRRSCTPGDTPIIGDACAGSAACPSGSHCQKGLCLPARPQPGCWLDGDCGDGQRCVLGSCGKAGV